jgi:GNAT superfamily N-acetyltransferase
MSLQQSDELWWDDPDTGLAIRASGQLPPGFAAYLEQQYFGGKGLQYRRLDMERHLQALPAPRFISLERAGELCGSYVLASLPVHSRQGLVGGCYRGLLSVAPAWQGQGLGLRLVQLARAKLAAEARDSGLPLLSWGCIERDNQRSNNTVSAAGGQPLGMLESSTLFRQWPRETLALEEWGAGRAEEIQAHMLAGQADCNLALGATANGGYFAFCDSAGLVAGARAVRTRVALHTIGGGWDLLDRYLLRFSKAARRRFDPHNFTYLRLAELVMRPGSESQWPAFLSSLLARHEAYMAMLVLDPRSELYRRFRQAGLFGRLSRIAVHQVQVMAMGWNWPQAEMGQRPGTLDARPFMDGPLAIGPVGF